MCGRQYETGSFSGWCGKSGAEGDGMNIGHLIASPEGKALKFKQDISSPKPILKSLVAFANGKKAGTQLGVQLEDDSTSQLESKLAAKVILLLSGKERRTSNLTEQPGHKSLSDELNKQVKHA